MGVAVALSALRTWPLRHPNSSSGDLVGSPTGCGMSPDEIIRLDPAIFAMEVIAARWAAGIPFFSIIFVSVAPQRVLVPQVLVTRTAWTPSEISALAISSPILSACVTVVPVPVVV